MANYIFISNFKWVVSFKKAFKEFDLFEESKTYSNGNLLVLPKSQILYFMSSEE